MSISIHPFRPVLPGTERTGAAAWLAQHMWWRWEYGRDVQVLSDRIYPFLKEVVLFYEDYLIEDESGTMQFVPSQSPENRFQSRWQPSLSLLRRQLSGKRGAPRR